MFIFRNHVNEGCKITPLLFGFPHLNPNEAHSLPLNHTLVSGQGYARAKWLAWLCRCWWRREMEQPPTSRTTCPPSWGTARRRTRSGQTSPCTSTCRSTPPSKGCARRMQLLLSTGTDGRCFQGLVNVLCPSPRARGGDQKVKIHCEPEATLKETQEMELQKGFCAKCHD